VTDVAVAGGGIVGLAVARALALRGRTVTVFEREPAIGAHQTSHNSGVIHAGIYYRPGTLKARLCREGAEALYAYCAERGLAAERCGKLVVAVRPADLPRLDELERRARENGVPGVRRLGPGDLRAVEPAIRGLGALHSPETGMTDFAAVAASFARDVEANGGRVLTGRAVRAIVERPDGVELLTESRVRPPEADEVDTRFAARRAVACAGGWSDRLAAASGAAHDLRIVPFRGSYLRLRPERTALVRGQIYPVPDPALPFLGVHLSRTIGGDVLLGPSALLAGGLRWPGTWRVMRRHWRTGAHELARAASRRLLVRDLARYVPELGPGDVVPGPSGVRAQAVARDGALLDDFAFAETAHAIHVLNAPSPAATAALAIAELVAGRVEAMA
jgi:2-hydroxyglutarate dehydrogenase